MLKEEAKKAEAEGIAVPVGICDRTIQVQKALLAKAEKENCEQIRDQDLQAIVRLDLSGKNIIQLKANDFSSLTSLQMLFLQNNELASLPEGLFSSLTSLQRLDLDSSFQQEKDRIRNEVGRDINIRFEDSSDNEGSSDDPWYKFW